MDNNVPYDGYNFRNFITHNAEGPHGKLRPHFLSASQRQLAICDKQQPMER